MSGTATANIFSCDPAKKFDVIFSIDMKQLLTALGAKPEQWRRSWPPRKQNRRKPIQWGGGAGMVAGRGELRGWPAAGRTCQAAPAQRWPRPRRDRRYQAAEDPAAGRSSGEQPETPVASRRPGRTKCS